MKSTTTKKQQLIIIFFICIGIIISAYVLFSYLGSHSQSEYKSEQFISDTAQEPTLSHTDPEINPEHSIAPSTMYLTFSLITEDFLFPENSTTTIREVIRIHEQYSVPINIYLSDPIIHAYQTYDPDIFDVLRESEVVSVGYHVTAPYPWITGFDSIGLETLSPEDLYTTFTLYQEHRIDTSTGKLFEEPGGYQYLSDLLGYAPLSIYVNNSSEYSNTLAQIYLEKGAQFITFNDQDAELGDTVYDLFIQPAHNTITIQDLSESDVDVHSILSQALSEIPSTYSYPFIQIQMNDYNWYAIESPLLSMYWSDSSKTELRESPFLINNSTETSNSLPKSTQDIRWERYENLIQVIASDSEKYTSYGLKDLEQMIE